ncbi:MAG: ATP-binding cassette domain-containing protein [Halobacteriota archaeon]
MQIRALDFSYRSGSYGLLGSFARSQKLFHRFQLTVSCGDTLALMGRSAVGKSTLLRLISGQEIASAGDTIVFGKSATDACLDGLLGFVPQNRQLLPWKNVWENIAFPSGRLDDEFAREICVALQIDGLMKRRINTLSGGQGSRVALARAIARRPRLLLLDEAFSSLDPFLKMSSWQCIKEYQSKYAMTIIFATHDISEVMMAASHVVVLRHSGSIQQCNGEKNEHVTYTRIVGIGDGAKGTILNELQADAL